MLAALRNGVRGGKWFSLMDKVYSRANLENAWRKVKANRGAEAGLTLHPEKTRIVDATQKGGFDFLGYHFERGHRWPREKSLRKFRDTIRAKTRRTNGQSLTMMIADINRTARGWYEYFKHSTKSTFLRQDEWTRGRLRSVLRRRTGRKGISRCLNDHQTWTIDFFRAQGLFSLMRAHTLSCQSPCG